MSKSSTTSTEKRPTTKQRNYCPWCVKGTVEARIVGGRMVHLTCKRLCGFSTRLTEKEYEEFLMEK